jgi:thiaminase
MLSIFKRIFKSKEKVKEERDWYTQHCMDEYKKSIEKQKEALDELEKTLNEHSVDDV